MKQRIRLRQVLIVAFLTLAPALSGAEEFRVIEDIKFREGGNVVITYDNGQVKSRTEAEHAAAGQREEEAFDRFMKAPSDSTYMALTMDQKLALFDDGLWLDSRITPPQDAGSITAIRFAYAAGKKSIPSKYQADVVTSRLTTSIFNSEGDEVVKKYYSFATSLAGGAHKDRVLCGLAAEKFIEDPTEYETQTVVADEDGRAEVRESTLDERLKFIVRRSEQWLSGFKEFISGQPDQTTVFNTHCPELQNNIQNILAAQTAKLKSLKLEQAALEPRANREPRGGTRPPPARPLSKSWCSEREIKRLIEPAIAAVRTNPRATHYFSEQTGTCLLMGELGKHGSGQFVFRMRRQTGEGAPLDFKFFHVDELVNLIKSNQGSKPADAKLPPAQIRTTDRPTDRPRSDPQGTEGGLWNPFGNGAVFGSRGTR